MLRPPSGLRTTFKVHIFNQVDPACNQQKSNNNSEIREQIVPDWGLIRTQDHNGTGETSTFPFLSLVWNQWGHRHAKRMLVFWLHLGPSRSIRKYTILHESVSNSIKNHSMWTLRLVIAVPSTLMGWGFATSTRLENYFWNRDDELSMRNFLSAKWLPRFRTLDTFYWDGRF